MIKIKVIQAVAICNIMSSINQSELGDNADKVVDIYIGLLPYTKDYNEALINFQREAHGKKEEEIKNFVSTKALERIANKEVNVEIPSLTTKELREIGGNIKDFKLSNYQILYAIVKD